MKDSLYQKQIKCPVCKNQFSSLKAKINACKVLKKDEDFCTHYQDINPIFYEIFVCPCCSYSASESSYEELNSTELHILKEKFSGVQVLKTYCSERDVNDALASFKLALHTATLKNAKNSIIAGLCLKIAWMYRYLGDEKEKQFLAYALDNYKAAYDKERFPIGNLDQMTMQYLLGELSRRLENYDEAGVWFNKVIQNPFRSSNPRIDRLAREQWSLLRDLRKKSV